jgi:hypothetical protein
MPHATTVGVRPCAERCDRLVQPPQLSVVSDNQFPHGFLLSRDATKGDGKDPASTRRAKAS